MRRSVLMLAAAAVYVTVLGADAPTRSLDATLARLARVAELYRDSALGFACQEAIAWSGTETGHIQFAHLFIRDDHGQLRDFRTWKSTKRGEEVDPRDYRVPRFLESAYLWAFIFRADRQPLFRFEPAKEEMVGDRPAVVIHFRPRGSVRKGLNDWVGFARIDRKTSQILSVEAYTPEDWNRRVRRAQDVLDARTRDVHEDRRAYDVERIVTEFGFEKNGMRFPSHVENSLRDSARYNVRRTPSGLDRAQSHSGLCQVRVLQRSIDGGDHTIRGWGWGPPLSKVKMKRGRP